MRMRAKGKGIVAVLAGAKTSIKAIRATYEYYPASMFWTSNTGPTYWSPPNCDAIADPNPTNRAALIDLCKSLPTSFGGNVNKPSTACGQDPLQVRC